MFQFKTMDDETFVIDPIARRWGRASSILAAPSVVAASNKEENLAQYVFSEEGDLAIMGPFTYSLDGRTGKTQGPGAGLSSVRILLAIWGETLVVTLQANVPIKPDSFTGVQVKSIKYFIDQPEPKEQPKMELASEEQKA